MGKNLVKFRNETIVKINEALLLVLVLVLPLPLPLLDDEEEKLSGKLVSSMYNWSEYNFFL